MLASLRDDTRSFVFASHRIALAQATLGQFDTAVATLHEVETVVPASLHGRHQSVLRIIRAQENENVHDRTFLAELEQGADDELRLLARVLRGNAGGRELVLNRAEGILFVGNESVDLSRRGAVLRLLLGLIDADEPLSTERMCEIGWPNDGSSLESLKNRFYVAIRFLRRAGLEQALLRDDSGYRWKSDANVRVV